MALRRSRLPVPSSLIASATQVKMTNSTWNSYRLRDQEWQLESWRFYDRIGEFRFAANYVGSACSRVRVFVAEVDELGRIGKEVTDDDEVQAISDTLFGGAAAKSEQLRSIGVNLTVAGECYLVGLAGGRGNISDRDRWFVVAPSELRRTGAEMRMRHNGERITVLKDRDMVIRVWTPHPARPDFADAPARAALPILTELERLTMYVFSQIDSRLAGAGILPIPNNIDFPNEDGESEGVEGLMRTLLSNMTASLQGEGSASALAPILVEMSPEAIQAMPEKPITFESVLSEQAIQLRQEAIRRLATSLDMPPEILEGAAEANHWGMWYIEENAIKIHVEPLVVRIIDALTEAYLKPALKALGKNPDRYTFWYDTAPLTHRPNRLQDTLNLYERGITSRAEVLRAGDYNPDTAAPTQDEENVRFIKELMLRDPNLFSSAALREEIGIHIEAITDVQTEGAGPPPPPAPQREVTQDTSPTPAQPSQTQPANRTPQPTLIASADLVRDPAPLEVLADIVVTEALTRAGKRLLATRGQRGMFRDVPAHHIHTKVRSSDSDSLLAGAWDLVPDYLTNIGAIIEPSQFRQALHEYTCRLLESNIPHSPQLLWEMLRRGGLT
jgi:hypothetical protein